MMKKWTQRKRRMVKDLESYLETEPVLTARTIEYYSDLVGELYKHTVNSLTDAEKEEMTASVNHIHAMLREAAERL